MSVVLDRPGTQTATAQPEAKSIVQPRIRVAPEVRPTIDAYRQPVEAPVYVPVEQPVYVPSERPVYVPTEAPAKLRKKAKTSVGRVVAVKSAMFCGVFALTYVASTLSGHYLVEKSRNLSIDATLRASAAIKGEQEVQRRLDALTSASAIEDWALSHSFRPTDGLGQTSKVVNLVASNR